MKHERVFVALLLSASMACSSAAVAATPVRAADALPAANAVTTDHLPSRALKTMTRKEHLQGEAGGAAGDGAGLAYAGITLAGVAAMVAVGVSGDSTLHRPQSP